MSTSAPALAPAPQSSALVRYATASTIALFLVVGVTGGLMFFHVAPGPLKLMHEWLSLVFVVAAAVHVVRNWKGFVKVLKARATLLVFGATLLVGGMFFLAPRGEGKGNPMRELATTAQRAPLSALAPVLGVTSEELLGRLRAQGIQIDDARLSVADVAARQGMDPQRVLGIVLSGQRRAR